MSLLGTFFHGYFFAFHMLNIMSTNALLSGVIKSVTQNGKFSGYADLLSSLNLITAIPGVVSLK
jgi:hypothetical protein